MLKKRIIPCLDIKDGRTVKGINFVNLADAGDPVALARQYALQGADELVFLDITATIEKRKTFAELVRKVAQEINIPFTVGGGINTVEDVSAMITAGADKVSLNSAAVKDPSLLSRVAAEFGSQCVVVAIDAKWEAGTYRVYINGGRVLTGLDAAEWAGQAERAGAGEVLLTSMNKDGTRDGFDIELIKSVCGAVNIPVIASGGAGTRAHFKDVFLQTPASAALAASIFHFGVIPIPELKQYLTGKQIPIR